MAQNRMSEPPREVFVTGSTGLLGRNLVHQLAGRGVRVRALVRSADKARAQFAGLEGIGVITGDMTDVAAFAHALEGCDALFHTAAYFRDGYRGGSHREQLLRINVDGTRALLEAAHRAGVTRCVFTSSIAVLKARDGEPADETCDRAESEADDYYLSKILSERVVRAFLDEHPDFHASIVLPGWMWGPGDMGPTSAGQLALDVARGRLPAIPPGEFAFVDARDVAHAHIAALERGRRGQRYLAAGVPMTMQEIIAAVAGTAGVKPPRGRMPLGVLYAVASAQEAYSRLTGKPVLMSLASVRLLARELGNNRFDHAKSRAELGLEFQPVLGTIQDTLSWYRANGWLNES